MSNESIVNEDEKVFNGVSYGDLRIFANANGMVAVIQNDPFEGDQLIIIPPYHIDHVISALKRAKKDLRELGF